MDERATADPGQRCRWLPGLVAAAGVLALALACAPQGGVGTHKGNVAPDFSLPTPDGGAENLRSYRGRVVVLNFWATWSVPCGAEMPDLQAAYAELRERGLVVVGVNQGDRPADVAAFAREFGLAFPVLVDEERAIGHKYGVSACPTTFIIDRRGVIREVLVGGPLTRTAVRRHVEGLLK